MNEQEMREAEVPQLKNPGELLAYIDGLVSQEHDYGTCVYAMSMAAVAAFNYVAGRLGVTGFQASCADLDVLRRTRRIKGPFMFVDAAKMLYPQYDIERDVREAIEKWMGWASVEAEKLLAGDTAHTHPNVVAHWQRLANGAPTARESLL